VVTFLQRLRQIRPAAAAAAVTVRRRLVAALLAIGLLALPNLGAAQPSELKNPGFDQVRDGLPEGWFFDAAVKAKGQAQVLSRYPSSPGSVLELRPNAKNGGERPLGLGQILAASSYRGKSLSIEAQLAAEGGATAIFGVHAVGKGGELGKVLLQQGDSGGALTAQRQVLMVPAGADNLIVYVIVSGTSGRAIFDSLKINVAEAEANRPSAPSVARATPGADRAAEIVVDVQKVLRQVPATIFGTNIEWIVGGQGLWSASRGGLDPEGVRLGRELGPTLIRWPGGGFSDVYQWRDGIGPRDKRPTTPHYPKGPSSKHDFGTPEVAEYAKAVGAELLVTVNVGSGTAAQAADWVRYMNKDVGPRVKLWEIGNELYMKDDFSGGHMNADKYAREFLSFATAMRAVDPEIRLGGIGGLNYGPYRFIADERWSETVLRGAGAQMDFFAVHNAYAPVVIGVGKGVDPRSVYAAMLAAPVNIEANLRDLSRLIAKYESPARPISIAVTEWGPMFHALPDSPWVDHPKTMGSGLFVAGTLNVFLRNPRVEIANFFKLSDTTFLGWLGRKGEQWMHTAPSEVFQLYRKNLGRNLVQASVSGPTYAAPGLGVVAAVERAPHVDAVASYDNGRLVVIVVNNSETESFEGRLTLKGISSYGAAKATVLHADGFDAHAGSELPKIPGLQWAKQVDLGRFGRGAASELKRVNEAAASGARAPAGGTMLSYRLRPLSVSVLSFDQARP
jgi:alpha-L-arabinofuranosidase